MSSQIINIGTVSEYQYVVNPNEGTIINAGPISATATNDLNDVTVAFTKFCIPDYVDVGNKFVVQYKFENNTVASTPKFTSVEGQDDLITKVDYLSIVTTTGITGTIDTETGKFGVNLSGVDGTLHPGESVSAVITFEVIALPDNQEEFFTEATGTFTADSSYTDTSTCGVYVGNGKLEIEKVSDTEDPVASGTVITYTITIKNTGNLESTILTGNFIDTPPLSQLKDIKVISPENAEIVWDGTNLTNNSDITIAPSDSYQIIFSATVI